MVERTTSPFKMGTVVFTYHSRGPDAPQQIVLDCITHDKLQVEWASDFVPYKIGGA